LTQIGIFGSKRNHHIARALLFPELLFGLLVPAPVWKQGDQIGRIFAGWAIVFFVQLFKNNRSSPHFLATLFHGENHALFALAAWYKSPC
jgi:hypothetical protein